MRVWIIFSTTILCVEESKPTKEDKKQTDKQREYKLYDRVVTEYDILILGDQEDVEDGLREYSRDPL